MMQTIDYRFDKDATESAGNVQSTPAFNQEAVPLLPVHEGVLFPRMTVGFHLEDKSKVDALQSALPESREILVVPCRRQHRQRSRQTGDTRQSYSVQQG